MNTKSKIRGILLESTKGLMDRFAEGVIKFKYKEIYRHNLERRGKEFADNDYPKSFEGYVKHLKDSFGEQDSSFGIEINRILSADNPLIGGIPSKDVAENVINYILNYNEPEKRFRIHIVEESDVYSFIDKEIFTCDDEFFEFVWDKLIGDGRHLWNENLKDKLWGEIESEVEEKMGDEEWQEENGVTFDGLEREKSYFTTYWHYPIQSLGWDNDQLCEFYKDVIGEDRLFKVITNYYTKNKDKIYLNDKFYYVFTKNLFN